MKISFLILMLMASTAHARQIILEVPDRQLNIVENDVVDAEQWIRDAWNGKFNKCKSRLAAKEREQLIKEADGRAVVIPESEDVLADQAIARPDF